MIMTVKKKIFWIAALIIITAIIIVLCIGYFTQGETNDYEGTLVQLNIDFPKLL
jgi:hypothetical protein